VWCGAKPIAASKVEIVSGTNAGASAITDAEGRYNLEALEGGALVVRASAPGYETRTSDVLLDAHKNADFVLAEVPVTEAERLSLSGLVKATTGSGTAGIADAQVTITAGTNRGKTARTNAAGRYQIDDLMMEDVTVEASAPGHGPVSHRVALKAGAVADFSLTPTASAGVALSGRTIDVLSQAPLAGVAASGVGLNGSQTDPTGSFQMTMASAGSGVRDVTFSGPRVFERRLRLEVPVQDVTVSLVPSTFDMAAFDQMFRSPGLRRWTSAPPIVIEQRTVQYTNVEMSEGAGTADTMTTAEADGLLADLTAALGPLTANTFRSFGRVTRQTSPEGATIALLNPGTITVVRVAGLRDATGKWGWSRWLYGSDGQVFGALIMLDRDFERSASPLLRPLRAHELGHALGYDHVTGRPSVMNPDARLEPTAFDLDACRIAFQRQPGSRSPDIDPDVTRAPQSAGTGRWSQPIH
jgi:hypothetical protein